MDNNEKTAILNRYLEENEIIALGSRQPIQHVGGVIIRRIKGILPDVGDSLVAHVKDVAFQWIGDGDGDTVNLSILPNNEKLKKLSSLLQSEALKNEQTATADLNIFKHAPKTHPASYNGFVDTMLSTISNTNGQGIATNIKTSASVMELKLGDNPITFTDNVQVKVVKNKDFVVMDYAPLNDDVTNEDIPDFARIVNKDGSKWDGVGKKYLRTTAQHERLLILNAATDNTKEHLITKMWNMNYDSMVARIFKRTDGKPLSDNHLKVLKNLIRFFNYSPIRNGRDPETRMKLEDKAWYQNIKQRYNFINSSSEQKSTTIINQTKLKKDKLAIKDINISDKLVVDEFLILKPFERMLNDMNIANSDKSLKSWGPFTGSPLRYKREKYENTHFAALDGRAFNKEGLNQKIVELTKDLNVTEESKEAARQYILKFDSAWSAHIKDGLKKKAKGTR